MTDTNVKGPPPRRASGPEAPIQLCRIPRLVKGHLQTVRRPVLLRLRRRKRQRTRVPRGDSLFRRGPGSVLWKRLRARSGVQFLQGRLFLAALSWIEALV